MTDLSHLVLQQQKQKTNQTYTQWYQNVCRCVYKDFQSALTSDVQHFENNAICIMYAYPYATSFFQILSMFREKKIHLFNSLCIMAIVVDLILADGRMISA